MPKNEIYRDLYSKECGGLAWDENKYEVHHINANHSDNRIENLVLLPKALHKRLHMYYKLVNMKECVDGVFNIDPSIDLDKILFSVMSVSPRKFFIVKREVMQFVKLRDFIINSSWAELDFSHNFEKYLRLYDKKLFEKYCEGAEE